MYATKIRRLLAAMVAFFIFPSIALATYEVNNSQAATWLSTQQNIDGSWGTNPQEHFLYTVEAVQALRAVGQRNSAYYNGITWLENHAAGNADYGARRALTLSAHGDDVSYVLALLEAQQDTTVAGRNGWGLSNSYHQSPLDTAVVINSLANLATRANIQAGLDYLKGARLSGTGQGWPVAMETVSDPFVTAVVVSALGMLQTQDPTLAPVIADGLGALSSSVVSGSPVYLKALAAHAALLAGNSAAAQTWLTMLVSGQGGDGSWSSQVYDTALAMRALASADGADSTTNQIAVSIPDQNLRAAINRALGRNAMDSIDRSELLRLTDLSAVGMSISDLTGLEWATNLRTADLQNNNISSTAPIDGLTQLTSVSLDGNPVVMVAGDGNDQDVPTLPEWGVIIMAVLLFVSAARHQRYIKKEQLRV